MMVADYATGGDTDRETTADFDIHLATVDRIALMQINVWLAFICLSFWVALLVSARTLGARRLR